MIIKLEIDNCCGGGHCGPVPGYFYLCPHCNEDTSGKAFYPLGEEDILECEFCKGEIEAVKKIDDLTFEFKII